jgi:predicted nucleic acid-binding Zn ribbon protein
MPSYKYVNPEIQALEDLKQKIKLEQLKTISESGGKIEKLES